MSALGKSPDPEKAETVIASGTSRGRKRPSSPVTRQTAVDTTSVNPLAPACAGQLEFVFDRGRDAAPLTDPDRRP